MPVASSIEPSGHVVVSVVCCLVGDGDTGGGEVVAFEDGGGVEGGCTVPMFEGPDPSRGVKGFVQLLGGCVSSQTVHFVIDMPSESVVVWQQVIRPGLATLPGFLFGVQPTGPFLMSANATGIGTKLQVNITSKNGMIAKITSFLLLGMDDCQLATTEVIFVFGLTMLNKQLINRLNGHRQIAGKS